MRAFPRRATFPIRRVINLSSHGAERQREEARGHRNARPNKLIRLLKVIADPITAGELFRSGSRSAGCSVRGKNDRLADGDRYVRPGGVTATSRDEITRAFFARIVKLAMLRNRARSVKEARRIVDKSCESQLAMGVASVRSKEIPRLGGGGGGGGAKERG